VATFSLIDVLCEHTNNGTGKKIYKKHFFEPKNKRKLLNTITFAAEKNFLI